MPKQVVYLFLLSASLLVSSCRQASTLNITFTGDVILDRGVADELNYRGDSLLTHHLLPWKTGDFLLINYEGTFTQATLHQADRYNFKAPPERAWLLAEGGVTHASMANNHSMDFGKPGFDDTQQALLASGIQPMGAQAGIVRLTKGDQSVGVLAASLTEVAGLSDPAVEELKAQVRSFQEEEPAADLVLYLHWGREFRSFPAHWQQELAAELVDLGVDLIIGHHPHIVQTVDVIGDTPVFYSLGNFVADPYLPEADYGLVVNATFGDGPPSVEVVPVDLSTYFPKKVDDRLQHDLLHQLLAYSPRIALFKKENGWSVAPRSSINFQENTDIWLFPHPEHSILVRRVEKDHHQLKLLNRRNWVSHLSLKGELSELELADIDRDGKDDLLVGISKQVRFDEQINKRLNVFSISEQGIKAKWLGTHLVHQLESFEVRDHHLHTLERDANGQQYAAVYSWDHFGFELQDLQACLDDLPEPK
jgi:hypothetical protein